MELEYSEISLIIILMIVTINGIVQIYRDTHKEGFNRTAYLNCMRRGGSGLVCESVARGWNIPLYYQE